MFLWIYILKVSKGIKNNREEPKAFIHIGPPKTATTHIQSILNLYKEKLSELGYTVISQKEIKNDISNLFKELINRNRFQKNLIVSAESLSAKKNIDPLMWLEFLHGYNVTIISTYREVLSRRLSNCHQHMSMGRIQDFNCMNYINSVNYTIYDELDRTFQIAKRIGVNKIKLVDYYGILAAKGEISYVILCKIIGVLCVKTKPDHVSSSSNLHDNKSLSPTWVYITTAYTRYVGYGNCQRAYSLYHDSFDLFSSTYLKLAHGTEFYDIDSLPYLTSNLSKAVYSSQLVDNQLRNSLLKSVIMYGNATANRIASENFVSMKELDGKSLDSNKKFKALLQKIYDSVKC